MVERRSPSLRELLGRVLDDELSAPLLIYLFGLFGIILLVHVVASAIE